MHIVAHLIVRLVTRSMARYQAGRWVLSVVLLLFGVCSLLFAVAGPAESRLGFALGAVFFLGFGLFLLVPTLRISRARRRGKRLGEERVAELKASGKLLPIPASPPTPKAMSKEDVERVADYVKQLAAIPWGDNPTIPEWEVRHVFDRTVARVRRVAGDWSQLREPIAMVAAMPKPLCYVGAAEVMFRLSFMRGSLYAPEGLRQGLRFIARVQFFEALQPDALVIRTKLLSGYPSKYWLELADQTLALLKEAAPNHPRIPNAEQAIHAQRGEQEQALACTRQTLAYPPSPEEEYVALTNVPLILQRLKRNDEALAAFDEALARDPRDPWVWHNKSLLLMELNRDREALDCNTRALSLMQFGMAQQTRARILAKLGATQDA